mmetsp:Transcript_26868/g.62746  ORF Transcript_26868/g.62746 Transcript_26868/m.62746 type:complete len:215 (+) Transcript_26868:257-901(+)
MHASLSMQYVEGERCCSKSTSTSRISSSGSSSLKALIHSSIWSTVVDPVMIEPPALHARCFAQASAISVGEIPYFSASFMYASAATIEVGMPYRGWKPGWPRMRDWLSGRSAFAALCHLDPSKYLPVSTPPARTPYGSPTTPKRCAASHVSDSYVLFSSEKSFWHETGRGTPSRSAVVQNMVMPKAFSLESPQCLMRPASSSRFTESTCRSKTS